ncbi:MAG: hypothetical protein AB8B74_04325 [Crocinitomicaceae bacterium]
MKVFFSITFLLATIITYCQNHEVSLSNRFGIANSQFKKLELANPETVKHAKPQAVYDLGFGVDYKYQIWKKARLFVTSGIYFSKAQYTFLLYGVFDFGAALEQVVINRNRIDLQPIGLSKQLNFFQDNLVLEFGVNMIYRHFQNRNDRYLQDSYLSTLDVNGTKIRRYKYDINVNYGRYLYNPNYEEKRNMNINWAYSFSSKYKLRDNFFLNIGFLYQRNYYFAYDYSYDFELQFNGGGTGVLNESSTPSKGDKYMIKDDFINITIGLSYKFGKSS